MFKAKTGRRFLALLLAILCMATATAPSFAMGFDDLQTVIDMTTGGENSGDDFYDFPEDTAPAPRKKPLRRRIPHRLTPAVPCRRSLAKPRRKKRKRRPSWIPAHRPMTGLSRMTTC